MYIDEFTETMDTDIGKDAIDLLQGLGYKVNLYFGQSGRAQLSKGFLKPVQKLATVYPDVIASVQQALIDGVQSLLAEHQKKCVLEI